MDQSGGDLKRRPRELIHFDVEALDIANTETISPWLERQILNWLSL